MADSSQQTVDSLLSDLEQFRLPVLCDLTELQEKLKSSNMAAKDIAVWVTRSPVICLYAQAAAGKANKGRTGEIAGVEHALSMLGVSGIQKIADQLKPSTEKTDTYLRQVTAESLFAAFIADEMAKHRRLSANENMAAALFCRAAEWLVYWSAPRRAWQLRRMGYRKPFSGDQLGELLFGFRLGDLQAAIAEKFVLPNLSHRLAKFSLISVLRECIAAKRLLRQQKLLLEDCSRELRLHLGAPEMLPLVANKLSQVSCSPWLRGAWGSWVDFAAINCHCTTSEINQMIFTAFHKFNKSGVTEFEYPALSALICEPSATPYHQFMADKEAAKKKVKQLQKDRRTPKARVADNASETKVKRVAKQPSAQAKEGVPKAKATATKKGGDSQSVQKRTLYTRQQEADLRKLCALLSTKPESFKNLQTLVAKTLQHFIDETPVERMAFFIVSKDGQTMKALMTKEKPNAAKLPAIKIAFNQTTVLQKFMAKQTFLQFDKTKHEKYWGQFPKELIASQELNSFLINSIFYSGKVRAFLYADMSVSHSPLPDIFLKDFKRMATAFAAAMRHFAQK